MISPKRVTGKFSRVVLGSAIFAQEARFLRPSLDKSQASRGAEQYTSGMFLGSTIHLRQDTCLLVIPLAPRLGLGILPARHEGSGQALFNPRSFFINALPPTNPPTHQPTHPPTLKALTHQLTNQPTHLTLICRDWTNFQNWSNL